MKWNNEVKWNVIAWLVDCAEIQIYVMFLTMFRRCWENFQYKIFVSYLEAFFEWNRRYSYTHKHTHTHYMARVSSHGFDYFSLSKNENKHFLREATDANEPWFWRISTPYFRYGSIAFRMIRIWLFALFFSILESIWHRHRVPTALSLLLCKKHRLWKFRGERCYTFATRDRRSPAKKPKLRNLCNWRFTPLHY